MTVYYQDDSTPGTPVGVEGHRPIVPQQAGSDPWCECGYRWNRKAGSLLVGEHISAESSKHPELVKAAGWLI